MSDEMIQFVDGQMKGWFDWDIKLHYELVKEECQKNLIEKK
jgi:hypothetical protein